MSGPNWSEVRPGLIELFTELAQAPNGDQPNWLAEWRDGQRKAAPNAGPLKGVTLTMRITTVAGVGRDEIRYEESGKDLQETLFGLRKVTLNLECESSQVDDSQWALSVLERIRARMWRGRVIDRLLELNVGVIDVLAARDISGRARQHTLSRAAMDLLLNMVSSDADPVVVGVITSVVITPDLKDVSGVAVIAPPDDPLTITSP
jgi:hypothetical protein